MSSKCTQSLYSDWMEETFGAWLRHQIERLYPSQAAFAREIGVIPQVVNNWVLDKNKPEMETLAAIARALGVSHFEVAERAGIALPGVRPAPRSFDDAFAEAEALKPVPIPIIKDLVAHMGAGGGFIDDYIFLPPQYRVRRRKGLRGIVARGTCMEPEIKDGDAVIFDLDTKAKPGDRVVAAVDGHVLVRRLVEIAGRLALRADADGETHVLGGEDEIYGTVLGVQRMFPI